MPDAYDRLRDSRVSRVSSRAKDTEADAYHLGLQHAKDGLPVSKNPYDKHTPGQMSLHYQYKNGHEKGSSIAMKTEAKMTDAEMKKREEIVKSMKKNLSGFRKRYGERAKEVMYATATKQAMKEETEELEDIEEAKDPLEKRVTARKHMGDDAHSWAVFVDNKPFVTGLGKSEVNYHKQKAIGMLKSKQPQTVKEAEELDESQKKIEWLKNMIKTKTENAGWNGDIYNRDWKKEVAAHKKELATLQKSSTVKEEAEDLDEASLGKAEILKAHKSALTHIGKAKTAEYADDVKGAGRHQAKVDDLTKQISTAAKERNMPELIRAHKAALKSSGEMHSYASHGVVDTGTVKAKSSYEKHSKKFSDLVKGLKEGAVE